ncbi:class I adenylate-forming enzyme family protein [Croceicoccus sp. BE223]|uniref:class I adenylate-forming enzyme family protein n=1 Tax=Croceicoccus sp. BE223 TaxID=2817716 RepID=UPI00285FC2A1|nr:class I adenylate-forming enzyme family protein [Croceicoccus sp. BE223]MDR7103720.1 acyl-CoA synthetase (AMP-forming)/AMP-acid ligase II [Croceicoccus sp. BE223]
MTEHTEETLAQRIEAVLALDPAATAVEYQGSAISWAELEAAADDVERLLEEAGVEREAPVGWAARNRPTAVATFIALVRAGRMVVPLRPAYNVASFREDILAQKLKAVIGDPDDWSDEGVVEAAKTAGSVGVEVSHYPFKVRLVPGLERPGSGPHRDPMPDYVLERLTSGTTGAPKRIPVKQDILIPSLSAGDQNKQDESKELTLKTSPALLFKPFSHAGGLFGLLFSLYQARPIVLFEKFNVPEWVDAVAKYRPKAASLVPAMIRMVLDADVPPEKLDSLIAIRSGTAPLEIDVQERFESRFDCAILVDYGAAEFIGGLAGWTLKDHKQYSKDKRGSVGRAKSDVKIRVVDQQSFEPCHADEIGIVEVKSERYGPDWIRTNDLARIDADGFIFLEGRADDAINRGGFKVLPEEVAQVLRKHPGIADAAVVGMKDERLGQVPIAAIELAEGRTEAPAKEELDAFLKQTLPSYMVPVEYRVLDELPRTISMKVSRPELKALLGI